MGKKKSTLRLAGSLFLQYAKHHYAKNPPDVEKGDRNAAMAKECYKAAGDKMPEKLHKPVPGPVERQPEPQPYDGSVTTSKGLLQACYDANQKEAALCRLQLPDYLQGSLDALVEVGYAAVDDLSDMISVTTGGRTWLGILPDNMPDLSAQVAEVTGNINENELSARYLEEKIKAVDHAINNHQEPQYSREMSWIECYQHIALVLKTTADEFRQSLHLPAVHIEGRVIPYNETRDTGVFHADSMRMFFEDVYARNVKAGWWTDIETGQPKKRNVGELFILFITEIAEAYTAYRDNLADDKISDLPGLVVELADVGIRWADFCGALLAGNIVEHSGAKNPGDEMFIDILDIAQKYEAIRKTPEAKGEPETGNHIPAGDVASAIDRKLAFNASRPDHRIENRLKDDGKKT